MTTESFTQKILQSLILLSVFSGLAHAEQPRRAENSFFINGKNIEVTPILQQQLRESWSTTGVSGPFKSALPLADTQWVHDFISISEMVKKPSCHRLKLLNTERRKNKKDTLQGRVIKSGLFDEQWTIDACGEIRVYRVFNESGSSELSVYELTGKD